MLCFSDRSRTIGSTLVSGFVEGPISGFGLDIDPRRPRSVEPCLPSARVWLIALQDGGRGRRIDDLLRNEIRCVSASTGESLVRAEDDILVYDPSLNDFVYASSEFSGLADLDLDLVASAVFSGRVVGKSVEMLFVDFRGGPPASRPERGASPIRKVVDRVASPRDASETAHLCLRGLSLFARLDGSIEGILCQAMAGALLKQQGDSLDALVYLRRARKAFGEASLTAPSNAAEEAYRKLVELAVRRAQPELPLGLPGRHAKIAQFVPARLGFSSRHAVGFAIETNVAPRSGRRPVGPRMVLGRIPARLLFETDFLRELKHETIRPTVEVVDGKRIAGHAVRMRTVLDGELPTLLGVAGAFRRPDRATLIRIQADNAKVERAVVSGEVGRPLCFDVVPRAPGLVDVKVSFLADGSPLTTARVSFRAMQDHH
jgi:hypothetical protein